MPKHPWSKELSIYTAKHWGDGLREEVEWSCVAYMQAVPPNAAEAEGGEAAYERRENGVNAVPPNRAEGRCHCSVAR